MFITFSHVCLQTHFAVLLSIVNDFLTKIGIIQICNKASIFTELT